MFSYFSQLIADRIKNPGDDLVSAFVHGKIDEVKFDEMEVLFNCFLLVVAGQETTRYATSGGMIALTENPGAAARLRPTLRSSN